MGGASLLALLPLAVVLQATSVQGFFSCPSAAPCSCTVQARRYAIECPSLGPLPINLNIEDANYELTCNAMPLPSSIINIPRFENPEPTQKFIFTNCSMEAEHALVDAMLHLRATNPEHLIIQKSDISKVSRAVFRNQQSVRSLELIECVNFNGFPDDLLFDMKNLRSINLYHNNINTLPANFFSGTPRLQSIELGQNQLTALPAGLFANLANLTSLSIWSNKLTTIDASVFKDLAELQVLELMTNQLTTLPADVFANLPKLRILSLRNNFFKTFPEGLLKHNTLLRSARLSNNNNGNLDSLPARMFANLTFLKEVNLAGCGLSSLPDDTFANTVNLQTLNLQYNKLKRLPAGIFNDTVNLESLDLERNGLEVIEDGVFRKLAKLKTLNLNYNKLKIEANTFYGLKTLTELNLSNNKLVNPPLRSFTHFPELRELDLSYNNLTLFDEKLFKGPTIELFSPFNDLLRLEKLNLQNNNIAHYFNDWRWNLLHLQELNLRNNKITTIDYSDFSFVRELNLHVLLDNNKIEHINLSTAERLAAQTLHNGKDVREFEKKRTFVTLYGNPIRCDCRVYDLLRYIDLTMDPLVRYLVDFRADDLKCTGPGDLTDIPLKQLDSKKFVCAIENGLRTPAACGNGYYFIRKSDQLLIMQCANLGLAKPPRIQLDAAFEKLDIRVDMSGNNFTQIPGPGMGYENVIDLDLSNNRIETIQWVPPKIKTLKLHGNKIEYLNSSELSLINTTSLQNITFHDNPWQCDCDLVNFTKYLQDNFKKVLNLHNITCADDTTRELASVTRAELCPMPTEIIIALCVMLAILGIVVGVLAAVYYRYQQPIKVWLYAHNMCLYLITERELDQDKRYDAFISFSQEDEEFVVNELMPGLEQGPNPFKLCVHYRNWQPGEFITTNIAKSIEESRRTVVVLSRNFLRSEWGKMEFRTAHTEALKEGRARVIVILYGDIGPTEELDAELRAYLSTNTYLKWDSPWFWDNLRYAMPHPSKYARPNERHDDLIDLVHEPSTPPPASTPPADAVHLNPLLNKTHSALNVALIDGNLVNYASAKNNNHVYA